MSRPRFPKIRRLRTPEAFQEHLRALDAELPFAAAPEAGQGDPLARPLDLDGLVAGNRFAVLPMEGWDATRDGLPSDLVRRRWLRFATGGAKLLWGCEAVAVRPDGRANPNQLLLSEAAVAPLARLREEVCAAHAERFGTAHDLVIGLQLTHSGRFARPDGAPRPRVAYRHPLLDRRVGVAGDDAVLSDAELSALVEDFVRAAVRAREAGFDFVDVKHCHGYLLHELLSARERPGPYGGDLGGRTRLLREVLEGVRSQAPGLRVGVRLSAYDFAPFRPGADGVGEPEGEAPCPLAFGGDGSGTGVDLGETDALLSELGRLGVRLVCVTAGSPYYNPHIQRPATFPPSDGYQPPEDPLAGVARMEAATAELKRRHPELVLVGSGYSYLQEWLPAVARGAVGAGRVDAVGIGRMALSYPDLPTDVLAGRSLRSGALCRTFSDCTTAPRNGLVSGCYPLDPFYKQRPEAGRLAEAKRRAAGPRPG